MTLPLLLAVVFCALFVAGLVKGTLGLGMPLVGIAVLAFVMTPIEAAVVLLVPVFVTNLWQIFSGTPPGPLFRRLWPMLLPALAVTFATAGLLPLPDPAVPRAVLGFAITAYGLFVLSGAKPSLRPRDEGWTGALAGAVTGVIAGTTGIFLVPAVAYLQAIGLQRDDLVQGLSMTFLVAGIALAAGLALQDQIALPQLALSVWALLPAFAGMQIGNRLRRGLDIERFRKVFCGSLVVLGLYQMLSALF